MWFIGELSCQYIVGLQSPDCSWNFPAVGRQEILRFSLGVDEAQTPLICAKKLFQKVVQQKAIERYQKLEARNFRVSLLIENLSDVTEKYVFSAWTYTFAQAQDQIMGNVIDQLNHHKIKMKKNIKLTNQIYIDELK